MAFGIGITRSFATAGGTPPVAMRNGTALVPGDYMLRITGAPAFVLQGGGTIVATSTTGQRLRDGDAVNFTVDPTSTYAYVSIITEANASVTNVLVGRTDYEGVVSQPPAWV